MNIKVKIPFWNGKPDLEIKIDASIEARFHMKVALEKANLDWANLDGANLAGANLAGANLYGANLDGANLYGANLTRANLTRANLYGANLTRANLDGANLDWANLTRANLDWANLDGANLDWANLYGANLYGANLDWANLDGANLTRANLDGANLDGAKNIPDLLAARLSILPEGPLVGWKKCQDNVIVSVLVPINARRSNSTGRKCRAEYVEVLEVYGAKEGISQYDSSVIYRKGETVRCDKWCENRWKECAGGIHFFITRAEAEDY